MGRRRKRRLHARPPGPQAPLPPPEPETTGAEEARLPRSEGATEALPEGRTGGSSMVRCSKRPSVADSVPEREKRRRLEKLETDEGETTEEDEQATTSGSVLNGSIVNGSVLNRSDLNGADLNGSDLNVSDLNGSDQTAADLLKSDPRGLNGGLGSDDPGDNVGAGVGSSDPGPLLGHGDSETSIMVTCGRNEGRLYLSKLRVVVNERCRSKCIRTGNTWWTPNEFQFVSGRGAAKDWKRTVKHAGQCLKSLLTSGTLCLSSVTPKCLCDSCTSQGSGKTPATLDESDEAGRIINESGEDLSNGKLVENAADIRYRGIKRRRRIKRHIKGSAPLPGHRSDEPASLGSKKRRKILPNSKPEAHSDSTVSLSADGVFETGSGSRAATEADVTVAKSSDVSRTPGVRPVTEPPPIVEKRKRGRPKKKPIVVGRTKSPTVEVKVTEVKVTEVKVTEVKVTEVKATTENAISGQILGSGGATDDASTGNPDDAAPSRSDGRREESSARTGPATEAALPGNSSSVRLTPDGTTPILPASAARAPASPRASEAATAGTTTAEETSKSVSLASCASFTTSTESQKTTLDVPATTQDASLEARALPSDTKVEQESVDLEASIYGKTHPIPACPSDRKYSGVKEAQDGFHADRKQTEDDVIVSGDVNDDVKRGLSPVRDDVTETSLTASNTTEPRRKNAYLNAVIAELKRKKISRETNVTSGASKEHRQQKQLHQSTHGRHPSGQLQQPTKLHSTTAVSSIKAELCPDSKSTTTDSLIRDMRYSPSSGLTRSSPFSAASDPPIAFVPSPTIVDGKPLCLRSLKPDADAKDGAPASDSHCGSDGRRTDWWAHARGHHLPMPDFSQGGEAAFWRHLPSMIGAEGKPGSGGGGKSTVGGRAAAADMNSPLSISQLASICGLSQSQLASLPFPPPQFSLYPPYLFMGFPLQPLLPEFQSVSGSPATSTTTGGHSTVQRPPSRSVPPAASSAASAPSTAPSSQYNHHHHHQQQQQQQQQPPRRRRSHHHHHCKSSASASSGPSKDPLFRQPPSDHHAASFAALRKTTESTPTNHSAAFLAELNRWRSSVPGLSSQQPWTGEGPTKSSAPNKPHPTANSVQERKLWCPAAAIASSAQEYSSAYESIVPSRSSAHASKKEFAVTCRSYGDTSLAAHAHRYDSSAPVDFTRRFRAREEEERKYSSNTGCAEYPCDEQGVLDLSKK